MKKSDLYSTVHLLSWIKKIPEKLNWKENALLNRSNHLIGPFSRANVPLIALYKLSLIQWHKALIRQSSANLVFQFFIPRQPFYWRLYYKNWKTKI